MLAFLSNLGPVEIVVVAIVAILVFGKNLPDAAAKAFVQLRKFRTAVDDLKRDTGIEKEIRDIQRSVREAEWEARRPIPPATLPHRTFATPAPAAPPTASGPAAAAAGEGEGPEAHQPPEESPAPSEPPEERRRTQG